MAYITLCVCDLCKADGRRRSAIAYYYGENDQEFHCCKQHKKIVEEAGFETILLSTDSTGDKIFVGRCSEEQ